MAQGFDAQSLGVLVKESFESTFWQAFERNNDWFDRMASVKKTLVQKDIDPVSLIA